MSPLKRKSVPSRDEPSIKRRLLQHRRTKGMLDLPLGPLQLILAKVTPEKQTLLRLVCKQLQVAHTDYLLKKYQIFLQKYLKNKSNTTLLGYTLQVLSMASECYINSGYQSVFADKLMLFHRKIFNSEPIFEVEDMQRLLHEFYKTVEFTSNVFLGDETELRQLQHRRLIHTITLLKLLKQFSEFRVVSSGMNIYHWQLQLEVRGIYVGLRDVEKVYISEEDKLVDFLTIVAELLVYDRSKECISRITSIGRNVYTYGVKHQKFPRGARLNLKFSVFAPPAWIKLLENVINCDVISSFDSLCSTADMSIHLEVKCKQPKFWMINETMSFCILPLH